MKKYHFSLWVILMASITCLVNFSISDGDSSSTFSEEELNLHSESNIIIQDTPLYQHQFFNNCENDPRMPLFADKRSKVTFGRGN